MSGPDGRDDNGRDPTAPNDDETRPVPERPDPLADDDPVTIEDDGLLRWVLRSQDGTVVLVRDFVTSVAVVALIGLLLFAISGLWPPLVAVESGSMEPNMYKGDLIFLVDTDRFVGDDAIDGTGVVTADRGEANGYESFGQTGDVIVFQRNEADGGTPIIHRAHFWVEEGEDWIESQADDAIVGDTTCDEVRTCPAAHDGFVTKGDNNQGYDQIQGEIQTDVIRPEWISGKAQYRIPWLGHVRLFVDSLFGGLVVPSGLTGVTSVLAGLGLGGVLVSSRLESVRRTS